MRWLLRFLLFWAITGPLFYLFGLPYLLDVLSKKAQEQARQQCDAQMVSNGFVGKPDSPITAERAEKYCHCVSDGLILTKNDVFDLAQHKPAAGLNARAQSEANACTKVLESETSAPAPATRPTTNPDGLIHL